MGDGAVPIDGAIHIAYQKGLFKRVCAHRQGFDSTGINEIVSSTAVKQCFGLGHLVPHVNSQRDCHRVLLCTVHVSY